MSESGSRTDARQNRERLLDAAHEAIADQGVQAEIKDIAERAGVGVGTFYRNFGTKEELIQALIAGVLGEMERAMREAEAMESARDAMLHVFRAGWQLAEKHGALLDVLVDAGYDRQELAPRQALQERAAGIVRRGVETGEFRGDVPAGFMSDFLDRTVPFVYLHLRQSWGATDASEYSERLFMSALTGEAWPPPG